MKYSLGIVIPYYKNSDESELLFQELMEEIEKQIEKEERAVVCVVEDGQNSKWLDKYKKENVIIKRLKENKGVSYARNIGIEYLKDKVEYIGLVDSDDMIEENYIKELCKYAKMERYDLLETNLYVNGVESGYTKDKEHRNGCWSCAIKTETIGDTRFNEHWQQYEDVDFMYNVFIERDYSKIKVPTIYYYYYGRNPNSLVKRFNEKRIGKER